MAISIEAKARKKEYRAKRTEEMRPIRERNERMQKELNKLSPKARRILGMVTRAPKGLRDEVMRAIAPSSDLVKSMRS